MQSQEDVEHRRSPRGLRREPEVTTDGVDRVLRETQLEQGGEIVSLRRELALQGREMREGFATVTTGMAQITALLTSVEGRDHGDG